MRISFGSLTLASLTFTAVSCAALFAQSAGPYRITHTEVLGGAGGWDYVVPDTATHRIYIARQTRLMVVDEGTGKLIGEVPEVHGAHGTAIVARAGLGFASSSDDKSVVIFDLKTLKPVGRTPAAEDVDAAIYDAPSNRVFTMNGDANSSTVLDGSTGKLVKNLPLGGKPEYAVSTGDGKMYANLADKSEIVEIDTRAATVLRLWPTAGCKQPVPLAVDTAHHRLFSGCRSGVMAVSDYVAGKVVATVPIGQGVDGADFDPAAGDIFCSNGDGTLTVIHEDGPDAYHVIQTLTTPAGSRNLGLDPVSHKVYVVAADFGPSPAGGKGRRQVVAGTFKLLTIER